MLGIQGPGSAAIAILQGVFYGMPAAVWLPYIITTIQIGVLIVMIVYYDYFLRHKDVAVLVEIPDTLVVNAAEEKLVDA
jgi:hypothetical protein